jgi:hypothetical protein
MDRYKNLSKKSPGIMNLSMDLEPVPDLPRTLDKMPPQRLVLLVPEYVSPWNIAGFHHPAYASGSTVLLKSIRQGV